MEEDQLTYEQFIQAIIDKRGKHGCRSGYYERHHIKPKCLGGDNDSENMIDLFAHEHFIAHKLLAKEHPHDRGLQFAWWCMSSMGNSHEERYRCTPEEYEEAKIAMSHAMSEKMKGSGAPMYGKHPTPETLKKMSEVQLGHEVTPETRMKISKSLSGENHPMYGKHPTEETIAKLRVSNGGKNHSQKRPVVCIETGEIFWGAKEVEDRLGINKSCICMCCKGKHETAGGYHWKYADKEKKKN